MAPEAANQKRKRGRRTNASRHNDNPSPKDIEDADMDEAARPKKRGRPARTESPSQPPPQSPAGTKRKRGRPSLQQTNEVEDSREEVVAAEIIQPKKQGRPPRQVLASKEPQVTADEADDENEGNSSLLRRSARERRSVGDRYEKAKQPRPEGDPPEEEEEEEEEAEGEPKEKPGEENSSSQRRGVRDRRPAARRQKGAQENGKPVEKQLEIKEKPRKRRKRGRPSLNEPVVEEEEEPEQEEEQVEEPQDEPAPVPKKKRGRPPPREQPQSEGDGEAEAQRQPKRRGRPSPSGEAAEAPTKQRRRRKEQSPEGQDASMQEEGDQQRKGRPRRSDDAPAKGKKHRGSPQGHKQAPARSPSPGSDSSPPPPYRHLTTRTRRIPRHTIDSKWTPLDTTSVATVTGVLQSASRPVLLRLNNIQKHAQATAALNAITKRIHTKLTRGLPFPPATTSTRREDELEYERIVSGVQSLDSQLDPLLHGVELLKREKEREEKELERDYKALNQLSANARAEAREKRDQLRKMHVLVPERVRPPNQDDDGLDLLPADKGVGKVFSGLEDQELLGLAGEIGNHMESMRGNLQQIDGVVPAIATSRALLREALQPHLEKEQLDHVVLG